MAPPAYPSSDSSGDHDRTDTPKTPLEMNVPAWSMSAPTADLIALIPKLQGPSNFEDWEKAFRAVCKMCGLWQLVAGIQLEPAKPASTDADALADYLQKLVLHRRATDSLEGLILLTTEPGPYSYVEQFENAPTMMFTRLMDLYSPGQSENNVALFRAEKKAMGLKATDFASALEYANAMQALLNKLSIGQEHISFYIHSFLVGLKGTRHHGELYDYYARRTCRGGPQAKVEFHEIVRKLIDIEEVFQESGKTAESFNAEDRFYEDGRSNDSDIKCQEQQQQQGMSTNPISTTIEPISLRTTDKEPEPVKTDFSVPELSETSHASTPTSKKQQKSQNMTHQPHELIPVTVVKKPRTIQSGSPKVPAVIRAEPKKQSDTDEIAKLEQAESNGGKEEPPSLETEDAPTIVKKDSETEQLGAQDRSPSLSDPDTELEVDTVKALASDIDDSSSQSTAASEVETDQPKPINDSSLEHSGSMKDKSTAVESQKREVLESNTETLLPELDDATEANTSQSVTSAEFVPTPGLWDKKWSEESISLIDEDKPIGDNGPAADASGKWTSPTIFKQRQRLNTGKPDDYERQHNRKETYDVSESRGNGSLYICDYCGGMGHELRHCWFKHPDLAKNARWISDNADKINELGQRRSKNKSKLDRLQAKRQNSGKDNTDGRSSSMSGEPEGKKHKTPRTACGYCEEPNHDEESCWFRNPTLAPYRWQMVCAKRVAELRKKKGLVVKEQEKDVEEKKEERYVVGLGSDNTW